MTTAPTTLGSLIAWFRWLKAGPKTLDARLDALRASKNQSTVAKCGDPQ